ncbi:MAG: DUF2752 domain-containing protein [Pirellulales bacterium]|nr:DUF2752 domain-containing protein [Pirellulales bacterium]
MTPPKTSPNRDKSFDGALLVISLSILLLGLFLQVHDDGQITFPFLPDVPLPTICLFRRLFSTDCLTCGLTRSIIHLMHGDMDQAWAAHRLGWLFWILIAGQIPYRAWRLTATSSTMTWIRFLGCPKRFTYQKVDFYSATRRPFAKRISTCVVLRILKQAFWPAMVFLLVLNRFLK